MSLKVKLSLNQSNDGERNHHYKCTKCPYKTKKRRLFKAHRLLCSDLVSSSSDTDIVDDHVVAETNDVVVQNGFDVDAKLASQNGPYVAEQRRRSSVDKAKTSLNRKRKFGETNDITMGSILTKFGSSEDAVSTCSTDATEIQDNESEFSAVGGGKECGVDTTTPVDGANESPPKLTAAKRIRSPQSATKMYTRNYKCTQRSCDFQTKNAKQFLLHERNSHEQKDFDIYVCDFPSCSYSSKWLDKVKRHRSTIHGSKGPWSGETLPSPKKARLEKPLNPNKEIEIAVPVVESNALGLEPKRIVRKKKRKKANSKPKNANKNIVSNEYAQLTDSIRVIGKSEKNIRYQCTICGCTQKHRGILKRHIVLRHLKRKLCHCKFPGCEFICDDRNQLFQHKKQHSDLIVQCQECEYSTVLTCNLERHYSNHNLPNASFKCSICSYGGAREASIARHLHEHHPSIMDKNVVTLKKVRKEIHSKNVALSAEESIVSRIAVESKEAALNADDLERTEVENHLSSCAADLTPINVQQGSIEPENSTDLNPSLGTDIPPLTELSAHSTSFLKHNRRKMRKPHKISLTKSVKSAKKSTGRKYRRNKSLQVAKDTTGKPYYFGENGLLCCRFCNYQSDSIYQMRPHFTQHSRKGNVGCEHCEFKCRRMEDLHNHLREAHGGGEASLAVKTSNELPLADSVVENTSKPIPEEDTAQPITVETVSETWAEPVPETGIEPATRTGMEPVDGVSVSDSITSGNTVSTYVEQPAMTYSDKFTDDELICRSCSFVGKFPSDLQKHIANAHDVKKQFVCCICQRRYRWQQDLTNHMRMAHEGRIAAAKKGGTQRFQRRSSRKRRLTMKRRSNMKSNDLRDQPTRLFCRLCDYVASCRTHLIRHSETHTNRVAYHCEVCGYATQRKSDIKRHLEKYHSTKYSSEFIINIYIEKLEEDVIESIMDHERSVEALYENVEMDVDESNTNSEAKKTNDGNVHSEVKHAVQESVISDVKNAEEENVNTGMTEYVNMNSEVENVLGDILNSKIEIAGAEDVKNAEIHAPLIEGTLLKEHVIVHSKSVANTSVKSETSNVDERDLNAYCNHQNSEWFRFEKRLRWGHFKKIYCTLCDYETNRIDFIVLHSALHENLKRFLCTLCGKRFNHQGEISTHLRFHDGKPKSPTVQNPMNFVALLSHDDARTTLDMYLKNHFEARGGLPIKMGKTLPNTPVLPGVNDELRLSQKDYLETLLRCPICCTDDKKAVNKNNYYVYSTSTVTEILEAKRGMEEKSSITTPRMKIQSTGLETSYQQVANIPPKADKGPEQARRYKCSLCAYRSNQYADTEGHINKQHPYTRVAHVDILSLDEALATLDAYEQAFHKKSSGSSHEQKDARPSLPQTQTSTKTMYKCPICIFRHEDRKKVEQHCETHSQLRNYTCSICSFSTCHLNSVYRHLRTRHPTFRPAHKFVLRHKGKKKDVSPLVYKIEEPSTAHLARVLKSLEASAKQTMTKDFAPYDLQSLPKGTRIYKCSICAVSTPWLAEMETHICKVHGDALAKVCQKKGEEDCADLRVNASKSLIEQKVLMPAPKGTSLSPPVLSPQKSSVPTCLIIPKSAIVASSQQMMTSTYSLVTSAMPLAPAGKTSVQMQLLTSALRLASARKNLSSQQKQQSALLVSNVPSSSTALSAIMTSPTISTVTPSVSILTSSVAKVTSSGKSKAAPIVAKPTSSGGSWAVAKSQDTGRPCGPVRPEELKFVTTAKGRIFHCTYCPYRTAKTQHITGHLQFHSPHPSRQFRCVLCPYWTKKSYILDRHISLHTKQIKTKRSAAEPQQSPPGKLSRSSSQNDSRASVHACDICPYYSRSKLDLEGHTLYHSDTGKVKCHQCLYSVPTLRHLTQHAKVHTEEYKLERDRLLQLTPTKNQSPDQSATKNGDSSASSPSVSPQQPLRVKIQMAHKTTGQKMMSPSKQSSTYDPLEVASLKHEIVKSRIQSTALTTLPSDEDLVLQPITGQNANVLDVILHKNKELLNKTQRLRRCRYCPYSHILARMLRRHESMHGIELGEKIRHEKPLLKCDLCDHYSTSLAMKERHERVHLLTYVPYLNDVPEALLTSEDGDVATWGAKLRDGGDVTMQGGCSSTRLEYEVAPAPSRASDALSVGAPSPKNTPFEVLYDPTRGCHVVRPVMPMKLACERCPYGTTDRNQFQRHVALHGSRQSYACQFCDYSVHSKPMLEFHTRIHLKPNRNLLQVQTLNNLSKLPIIPADDAVAMRTNDIFRSDTIDVDNKTPVSAGQLDDRLLSLQAEALGLHGHLDLYENATPAVNNKAKDRPRLSCPRCPFSTNGESWLALHVRCHGGKNPWTCPYCDYACAVESLLNKHIKTHFLPKDAQGLAPKASTVFVRSQYVEPSNRVVSHGNVDPKCCANDRVYCGKNEDDVADEVDASVSGNDFVSQCDDVNGTSAVDEMKTGEDEKNEVDENVEMKLHLEPDDDMETNSTHKSNESETKDSQAQVEKTEPFATMEKSFAEFAASAVLITPEGQKETKFHQSKLEKMETDLDPQVSRDDKEMLDVKEENPDETAVNKANSVSNADVDVVECVKSKNGSRVSQRGSDIPVPLRVDTSTPADGPISDLKLSPALHDNADQDSDNTVSICPYCERSFANSLLMQKHKAQHLLGNHYIFYSE